MTAFDMALLPFRFAFMQEAFLIGIIIAIPTALLSCFLVLKGWALMGDAVSHAVLPGIVLAHLIGLPLVIGAFVAGMVCALATGYLEQNSRIKSDTIMGVVFSGMFGAGLVLFVAIDTGAHLDHILFGNILGLTSQDLWLSGLVSLLVSTAILLFRKDLVLHSFDPAQARASGLAVNVLHYGLLAALSLTIVATLSAVGIILAIGLLIAPGAIAFLLTRQFAPMMVAAVTINLVASIAGIYLSFFLDSAPAPTIILVLTFLFLLAFAHRSLKNRSRLNVTSNTRQGRALR